MGVYVVTGGSGGIGGAIIKQLKNEGHETINIDVKNGDINGNLASSSGRKEIIAEVKKRCPNGLDGLVCNAGVNGSGGNFPLIISLNYYGATVLAKELWPLLEKKHGNLVATVSNTISQNPTRTDISSMLVNGAEEDVVREIVGEMDQKNPQQGHELYVATKYALAKWVRRMSATSAARGVRVNAVAPGNVHTPMTDKLGANEKSAVAALPIPTKFGQDKLMAPEEIANVICYLLSKDSAGINGNIVFVDGGTDALLNTEKVY